MHTLYWYFTIHFKNKYSKCVRICKQSHICLYPYIHQNTHNRKNLSDSTKRAFCRIIMLRQI